jgi:hypothetical protein
VYLGGFDFSFDTVEDLGALPELRVVEGMSNLLNNQKIETLEGLRHLEHVRGDVEIRNNRLIDRQIQAFP